jgi:hypothetical protein
MRRVLRTTFNGLAVASLGLAGFCYFAAEKAEESNIAPEFGRVTADFWRKLIPFLLVLPVYWCVRFAIRLIRAKCYEDRNLRAGLCPACGYHLRATPDRCPEYGAVTAMKVTA